MPDPATAAPPRAADAPVPACSCGHTAASGWIERKSVYTGWGWFLVLFGISAKPERIDLRCRGCGDVIGAVTDEATLNRDV